MDVSDQIESYLAAQPPAKQADLRTLHDLTRSAFPDARQWYSDGTDESGKVVANPSVGYGVYTIRYANGSTREFYRVGLSANTKGVSVYVMGLKDKSYLTRTIGDSIGTADVTSYCIRFKRLSDIDRDVLMGAIRHGMTASHDDT